MIEVLFGESEAGAMKAAKSTVIIGKTDGPTAVWIAGKKKIPEKEMASRISEKQNTGWIPGTAEEVVCLAFMLDIGDIREAADSRYRRELIYSLYAQGQWETDPETDAELKRAADAYINERTRLENYLKDGETVRIWYSDAPYSRCGLYSLCTMLQKYENKVCAVKLPEYNICPDSIVCRQNWGEVAAEEFAAFLHYEKELTQKEIRMYAAFWKKLAEDNSPLRAVVNGRVVGVPEDFYDFPIWEKLTKEPIVEARLIGDILGSYQIGVGDWWYARRIEHFIRQGKITVVRDSVSKYKRLICMAG